MKLDVADRFIPARYAYGTFRTDPLGLGFHMTEGTGLIGDANYLAGDPSRGVSVHFVVLKDGTIIQMLDVGVACGGLNPTDRATADKGYYGGDILRSVLGSWWNDPNAASIQVEIGGKREDGPTAAQVEACIRLGIALRREVPSLRGAFGHADQTDTKGCPGTTPAMKAIFTGVGGHGPFSAGGDVKSFVVFETPRLARMVAGAWLYDNSELQPSTGNVRLTNRTGDQLLFPHIGGLSSTVRIIAYEGVTPDADTSSRAMFARDVDIVESIPVPPPPVPDPDPALVARVADLEAQVAERDARIAAAQEALA